MEIIILYLIFSGLVGIGTIASAIEDESMDVKFWPHWVLSVIVVCLTPVWYPFILGCNLYYVKNK